MICGDLDSAREDVIRFYKDKVSLWSIMRTIRYNGCTQDSKIVKIVDQDTTDLTKSINHIMELEKTQVIIDHLSFVYSQGIDIIQVDAILVINAINWGRFDQIMGVLHSLFLTHDPALPTHLLSADSFTTLLSPVSVHAACSINRTCIQILMR